MKKYVIVLLALLAGCSSPDRYAEKVVRIVLTDPDSAKFDGVFTSLGGDTCGLVNSKNRFGGYVGDMSFMIRGDKLWLANTDEESTLIQACCAASSAEEIAMVKDFCTKLPQPIQIYEPR